MSFADGSVQNMFCTMPTATAAPPSTTGGSASCTFESLPYCPILLRRSLAPGSMIPTLLSLFTAEYPLFQRWKRDRHFATRHSITVPFDFYGFCRRQRTERVLYHADCNRRPTLHRRRLCPLHSRVVDGFSFSGSIIPLLSCSAFGRDFSPASVLFPALLFRSVSERRMDKADSDAPVPNLWACSVTE